MCVFGTIYWNHFDPFSNGNKGLKSTGIEIEEVFDNWPLGVLMMVCEVIQEETKLVDLIYIIFSVIIIGIGQTH